MRLSINALRVGRKTKELLKISSGNKKELFRRMN